MAAELSTYQCRTCGVVAVAPFKAFASSGRPVRCNLCQSPMRWLWSEAITTDAQRAFAAQGVVYNPGGQPAGDIR